ncbi:hypothetical protein Bbelb_258410 [Branchiostoma belcheri]|nr:hypothetical protein Bbelb_258410 [Branchiostoma belcheri]
MNEKFSHGKVSQFLDQLDPCKSTHLFFNLSVPSAFEDFYRKDSICSHGDQTNTIQSPPVYNRTTPLAFNRLSCVGLPPSHTPIHVQAINNNLDTKVQFSAAGQMFDLD